LIRFLPKYIKTEVDFEGKTSLLLHTFGCNFKCWKCHNYEELGIIKKNTQYYTKDMILNKIKQDGFFFDAIILSGGEFLLNNIAEILQLLKEIHKIFDGLIMINTNGSFPKKIKKVIEQDFIDGFFMDIKFNIFDKQSNQDIIGIEQEQRDNILESFYAIKGYKLSEFRTVKYPIYDDLYFNKIEERMIENKVIWKLNYFIDPDEIKLDK